MATPETNKRNAHTSHSEFRVCADCGGMLKKRDTLPTSATPVKSKTMPPRATHTVAAPGVATPARVTPGPKRGSITFYHKFKCFMWNHRHRLSGANDLLKSWYYSSWDFDRCKKEYKGGKGRRTLGLSNEAAKRVGTRIDHELYNFAYSGSGTTPAKGLHVYTRALLAFLNKRNWALVGSQGIVGVPESKVATRYDLLVQTPQKKRILLEVKTGGESYFDEHGGQKLDAPLQAIESSRKTHAYLEVAFAKICYNFMHATTRGPVDEVHVLRVYGGESTPYVKLYPQPQWLADAERDIAARIQARQK